MRKCAGRRSSLVLEQSLASSFGPGQSLVGQVNGFRLACRIGDMLTFVKSFHGISVEGLPCTGGS